jgi:hypothetical protein
VGVSVYFLILSSFQDSAHERRWITPTEVSGRIPKLIGNLLAHVFPNYTFRGIAVIFLSGGDVKKS